MITRKLLLAGAVALPCMMLMAAQAPSDARSLDGIQLESSNATFATKAPAPWAKEDPADSLYRRARRELNDENFRQAARLFAQLADDYPKSAYVPEALYFRAYALYRNGRDADLRDALASLEAHRNRFPKARTMSDADQLSVRIKGELAKRGDAISASDVSKAATSTAQCRNGSDERDDIRAEAMNALLQMDAQSALPIIKEVLARRDTCSASLRKKAVFLLSQKATSETEAALIDVIRNDPSASVREDAVFWLGQTRSDQAAAFLEQLASTSTDSRIREKAVFSLSQQNTPRAFAFMRRIAEASDTPRSVRESAIFQIGQQRASQNADFLRELFGKLPRGEDDLRKNVLFSLSQMRGFGNDRWLLNVALDESQTVEVRKHALFCAGQAGVSGGELAALYDKVDSRSLKEQLIWVMSESRDAAASDRLVGIAQRDKDPEMRKKAIFWLGQKNDPRIRQILLDILKP